MKVRYSITLEWLHGIWCKDRLQHGYSNEIVYNLLSTLQNSTLRGLKIWVKVSN